MNLPGYPLATAERGKQVLVSMKTKFQVGDHDFSKFSGGYENYRAIGLRPSRFSYE